MLLFHPDTEKRRKWDIFLFLIFILLFLLAIYSSYNRYFHSRNYDYLVESSCDPTLEKCFVRDCTNPDDCPPNNLSTYKQYFINASDYQSCSEDSCSQECNNSVIKCIKINCDENIGDTCSSETFE